MKNALATLGKNPRSGSIHDACRGRKSTAYGFAWRLRQDEGEDDDNPEAAHAAQAGDEAESVAPLRLTRRRHNTQAGAGSDDEDGARPAKRGRVANGHQCQSQYVGVTPTKTGYVFSLQFNGRRIRKKFRTEKEAARARDDLVRLLI